MPLWGSASRLDKQRTKMVRRPLETSAAERSKQTSGFCTQLNKKGDHHET